MKTLIILFILSTQSIWAEGFLSMTDVTSENCMQLKHHKLKVECVSQQGTSLITLTVRPDKANPLISCDVIIYDESGKKRLLHFYPKWVTYEKKGLTKLYFYAADELVDNIEVSYTLNANAEQTHFFKIKKGWLKKVAACKVIKDGRVVAPVFSKQRINTGENLNPSHK